MQRLIIMILLLWVVLIDRFNFGRILCIDHLSPEGVTLWRRMNFSLLDPP